MQKNNSSFFKANHFYKCIKPLPIPDDYSPNFIVGEIYQAFNKQFIYTEFGLIKIDSYFYSHFEEVDIGLSDVSKRFIDKHYKSNKINFRFIFSGSKVGIRMQLSGITIYSTISCDIKDINEGLYDAYHELRNEYTYRHLLPLFTKKHWLIWPMPY